LIPFAGVSPFSALFVMACFHTPLEELENLSRTMHIAYLFIGEDESLSNEKQAILWYLYHIKNEQFKTYEKQSPTLMK
jgi:hypothetical protein